ncbi:MAG: hypothetical protein DRI88_09080 [Bacteroidetes bacterium]|nr:MAG: hypothetical protein DRI88_09080 [Bacteroidota bacterium]
MSFNPQEAPQQSFELVDEGLYAARLVRILEIGIQTDKYGSKPKVVLGFTVPALSITIDGVEKQKMQWTSKFGLNQTANPDGNLMKFINAIDPTVTHMRDLLGKPCMIEIKHTDAKPDGSQFANIANVTKPMAGLAIAEPDCDQFMFEFDSPSKELWDKLSESRQEDMKGADNAATMLSKLEGTYVDGASADVEEAPF